MTDAVAEIARYIDDERRTLEQNVSELSARATAALDWREQVRQHPALMVAAALGGGVVLAQLGGRPRHRTESSWNDEGGVADQQEHSTPSASPLAPIFSALFAAGTGALVTVLVEALSVPLETAQSAAPR